MIDGLTSAMNTARAGLAASGNRLARTADDIATEGATSSPSTSGQTGTVRVGNLPLPGQSTDPLSDVTSLQEDEMSFKLNALVLKTTLEMAQALYRAVD